MRRMRLLTTRIVLGNILVATLTSMIGILLLVLVAISATGGVTVEDYRTIAYLGGMEWLFGLPDGQPNPPAQPGYPPGFTLVVSAEGEVLHSQGDTDCRAGMLLEACAPHLDVSVPSERYFERDGERWVEAVTETVIGHRAITHRGPPPVELFLLLPGMPIYGTVPFTVFVTGMMALIAVPVALVLTWLIVRPSMRRLSRLAQVSRQFAEGDLKARVRDTRDDEVGALAQQFDDMADTLEQNFDVLRDLAQQNAALAQQAEESAIRAERTRISRDLHDAIAQRLFSLSVSTAGLPELIARDPVQGAEQARSIAGLAEHTLLDLRALLVDLRPTSVIQRGLVDALQALCDENATAHQVLVDFTPVVSGKRMPAGIEDVIYRVAQEALSNVIKHAQATAVDVSLVKGRRQITLSITDNGKGFESHSATGEGKFGLISMQERARSVGGMLTIESDTTRGTTLRLVLPLEMEAPNEDRD
jgi:NarL family two-component system sensor histidine kinase LiaS